MIPAVDAGFIKDQIDAVREQIGRTVTLYWSAKVPCNICAASGYYDSISDTSWFTTCPVCHGDYYTDTELSKEVFARIHWVSNEAYTMTPGGRHFVGEAHITVDPAEHEWLVLAQSERGRVVVDDQDFIIHKINRLGSPTINRIRAILVGKGFRPNSE